MSEAPILYQVPFSENAAKVRIGLTVKEIPFEVHEVDPLDRAPVVELSGQPLTPVLAVPAHGGRVVFDSAAILRYLEANFPGTTPLFSADPGAMRRIERWEVFARTEMIDPLAMVGRQYGVSDPDAASLRLAADVLARVSREIEEQLADDYLLGDRISAADVSVAPVVWLAMLPGPVPEEPGMSGFLAEHLQVPASCPATRAWVERVMRHDSRDGAAR